MQLKNFDDNLFWSHYLNSQSPIGIIKLIFPTHQRKRFLILLLLFCMHSSDIGICNKMYCSWELKCYKNGVPQKKCLNLYLYHGAQWTILNRLQYQDRTRIGYDSIISLEIKSSLSSDSNNTALKNYLEFTWVGQPPRRWQVVWNKHNTKCMFRHLKKEKSHLLFGTTSPNLKLERR